MPKCRDCRTLIDARAKRCWECSHRARVVTAGRLREIVAEAGEVHAHLTLVSGRRYWHIVTEYPTPICGDPERCVPVAVGVE